MVKIKLWDHLSLEIGFLAILHFIGQQMANNWPFMVMILMEMVQNIQTIKFCYCGSGEAFQFVTIINQSTKKQYSWNLIFTEFSGTYVSHVQGILPTSHFFCPGNWGRRNHSPNKKIYQIDKEKIFLVFWFLNICLALSACFWVALCYS